MFQRPLPEQYLRMREDLAAHVFTDNFYMVYQGELYVSIHKDAPAVGHDFQVYEVDKANQRSERVY